MVVSKNDRTVVFKDKSWEPMVHIRNDTIIYAMPVANGHFDKSFEFQISATHLAVLEADAERRILLYALLHDRYQPRPMTKDVLLDPAFDLILLGSRSKIEAALTNAETHSNGAVSALVAAYLDKDQRTMRQGVWFTP